MRAFFLSLCVLAVITAGAVIYYDKNPRSAAGEYSSSSVRLD